MNRPHVIEDGPGDTPRSTGPGNDDGPALWSWLRVFTVVGVLTVSLFAPSLGVDLSPIFAVMSALLLLGQFLQPDRQPWGAIGLGVVLFGLLLIPLVGSGLPESSYGREKVTDLVVAGTVSAAAVLLLRSSQDFRRFAILLMAVGVIIAVGDLVLGSLQERATGLDQNPIWAGRSVAVGVVAALWLLFAKGVRTSVLLASLAVSIAGLVFIDSRGPILGAAVGSVLLVFSLGSLRLASRVAIGFSIAVVVVTAIALFPESRLTFLVSSLDEDVNAQVRLVLWGRTIEIIRENPGGVGYGAWATQVLGPFDYPHNLFLEVAAEAGLVIGIAFVGLVIVQIVRLRMATLEAGPVALAYGLLVCMVVASSFSGDLRARQLFAFLVLGSVAMAVEQRERREATLVREARSASADTLIRIVERRGRSRVPASGQPSDLLSATGVGDDPYGQTTPRMGRVGASG